MTETETVTDRAAANFLTSLDTRFLLGPFMQRETTLSEAAATLGGVGLNTLHRRVKQMLTLRLIEVVREEVRRGHRVKLYRATSRVFVVPLETTSSVDLETCLNDGFSGSVAVLSRGIAKAMERSTPRWGFKIYWAEAGGVFQEATRLESCTEAVEPEAAARPSWYGDLGMRLTPEAAQTFQHELQKLYEKYLQESDDAVEGEPYFFFAGFTPL